MVRHTEMGRKMSEEMLQCIEECTHCAAICIETTHHCLQMGGEHAAPEHIRTLLDCAEMCQTSANFMLRMSDMHGQVCGVCAEACRRCAESCEQFGDDKTMELCAQTCRSCEESCRQMASGAH
jgi:hypothetical protein